MSVVLFLSDFVVVVVLLWNFIIARSFRERFYFGASSSSLIDNLVFYIVCDV